MEEPARVGVNTFEDGQFRGRTVRFRLELAQEPTVGRKSGEKDRRPLANVPIVRLWVSELVPDGRETRLDENHIDASSMFCSVDLCSPTSTVASPGSIPTSSSWLPPFDHPQQTHPHQPHPQSNQPNHPHPQSKPAPLTASASSSRGSVSSASHPTSVQRRNHVKVTAGPPRGGHATSTPSSSIPSASASSSGTGSGSTSGSGPSSGSSGTVSSISGTTQSSGDGRSSVEKRQSAGAERTVRNIFGNLVSPAVCLTDLNNEPGLWFVYQDIAIRTEGVYSLRFSLFDVDSRTADSLNHAPILAECFSSPLTIYAPRNHPGVPPSTKLAKHFVSQGYRLTLKKGGTSSSNSSSRRASVDANGSRSSSSRKRPARCQDGQSGSSEDASETPPNEADDDDEERDADAIGEEDDEASTSGDNRIMVE